MTFLEAKAELKKMANGRFHDITYELREYSSGINEAKCEVYIDPRLSASGATWNEALTKMRFKLGDKPQADLTEAPGEEKEKEE